MASTIKLHRGLAKYGIIWTGLAARLLAAAVRAWSRIGFHESRGRYDECAGLNDDDTVNASIVTYVLDLGAGNPCSLPRPRVGLCRQKILKLGLLDNMYIYNYIYIIYI